MIYVSADDINRCKPLLIFKSKDDTKCSRIKKKMTQYDSRVVIQWDSKTYCNVKVMIRWLKNQYKYATIDLQNANIRRLLSLDVFSEQKIDEIIAFFLF